MKKSSLVALGVVALGSVIFPKVVFADSQECTTTTSAYGQTSTVCKTAAEHVPVKAGVGDVNFWTVALWLTVAGVVLFGAAKVTKNIYWFD
jgi:hypothetical protein